MCTDGKRSDWAPTAAAQALIRNNRPLLAYVAGLQFGHGKPVEKSGLRRQDGSYESSGSPASFTSKDHNFFGGETVEKQLVVINNSRETVACECEWSLGLPRPAGGSKKVSVRPGDQERILLRFDLPSGLTSGNYELTARVRFGDWETQTDSFTVSVLPRPAGVPAGARIALLDPRGETGKLLAGLNVRFQKVGADADLSGYDVLIVGKEALTPDGPGPDVSRVQGGLKVIVFEQAAEVLEARLGFRVAEYGLRQVFRRVPDHPLLAGLDADHLRDWRGAATLLPPRLRYTLRPRYGPTVKWCGLDVTRPWRCGCRGNVASVLIEKPARGDFLAVLDGGYGLQYSPLLEYHEGQGMVLFCQADVTGRTEGEPAADTLARNILRYVAGWKPSPRRKALYAGDPAGKKHLESAGLSLAAYAKDELAGGSVLIVTPGGGKELAGDAAALGKWLREGGHVLALGLDGAEASLLLPAGVETKKGEHIAAYFEPPEAKSLLVGVGPADVHNRDPRELPLISAGATALGNGVLAQAENANVVFCQLLPWQFDPKMPMHQKRTFRRASVLVTRLASNLGAAGPTPLLTRFRDPVGAPGSAGRWLDGLYLDAPEEWDDPYRYFRW
jgi:hypothetical protein